MTADRQPHHLRVRAGGGAGPREVGHLPRRRLHRLRHLLPGRHGSPTTTGATRSTALQGSLNAHGHRARRGRQGAGSVAPPTLDRPRSAKDTTTPPPTWAPDSLGRLLAAHPDISYQVTLPSPFLDGFSSRSAHPHHRRPSDVLLLQDAAGQQLQMSFGKNKAEDPGGAPRRDVCRCGRRR